MRNLNEYMTQLKFQAANQDFTPAEIEVEKLRMLEEIPRTNRSAHNMASFWDNLEKVIIVLGLIVGALGVIVGIIKMTK